MITTLIMWTWPRSPALTRSRTLKKLGSNLRMRMTIMIIPMMMMIIIMVRVRIMKMELGSNLL